MLEICDYNDCTGCAACANVCGHSAITIVPDKYGFLHPTIAQSLCVDCGLCKKVCPNNTLPASRQPIKAYVGCAIDSHEQLSSTSGGIASVLSRHIIANGGVVYGSNGSDCQNIHHERIESEEEIVFLKGSKYVQSSIGKVFRSVVKDLRDNRPVLFIGTPCQVAGLLNVVPEKFKKDLFTIDFVCHGVPPQQMLSESLHLQANDSQLENLNLRFRVKKWKTASLSRYKLVDDNALADIPDKASCITQYGLFGMLNGKLVIDSPFPKNDYIVGFLTGLLYRDSCFRCHYAQPERVSDITLGDFHFTDKNHAPVFGENRILSKIIVNTEKGNAILEKLNNSISKATVDYGKLQENNSQLSHPMKPHPLRNDFLNAYLKTGMLAAANILKEDKSRIKRHMLITKLRNALYSIPFVPSLLTRLRNGK